jgi:hypothetical protein
MCFGASDSPLVQANTWGVATLLVVTVSMLAAFATFFVTLWRRERHAALLESASSEIVAELSAVPVAIEQGRC